MENLSLPIPPVVEFHECSSPQRIFCKYQNQSPSFQVVRVSNIPHRFIEHVVCPTQCLQFETHPDAQLEIYSYELSHAILAARIPCLSLKI